MERPLSDVQVIELSTGLAGAYCGKLLVDAGANVIKIEPVGGDPLRNNLWRPSEVNPLYEFLNSGKSSSVVNLEKSIDRASAHDLVASADIVLWSKDGALSGDSEFQPLYLRSKYQSTTLVCITPFGLDGPWADRPATPATLEAWSGGPSGRGDAMGPPVLMGGEPADWIAGMFAAIGALSARVIGMADLIDVSILECLVLTQPIGMFPTAWYSVTKTPWRAERSKNLPDVHPTASGLVGFCVVTGQQWLDFCAMVGREDWAEDRELMRFAVRNTRRAEMIEAIDLWMSARNRDEVLELADRFRVPAAPVATPSELLEMGHLFDSQLLVHHPSRGFVQPGRPYKFSSDGALHSQEPVLKLGGQRAGVLRESSADEFVAEKRESRSAAQQMPFAGLRIADFTAFWAGPMIGNYFAMLGAEVIHVESIQHPDGMRFNSSRTSSEPDWWEWGTSYQAINTNKLGLTLDLDTDRGRGLAKQLVAQCDVIIENFNPRVMEKWGLDYEAWHACSPEVIVLRAPAFSLQGPWRYRGGYAQTVEDASGLTWLTGLPDDRPQVPNGALDPIAGGHATIALLLALEQRRRTGEGMLVEAPMLGAALNIAAEQILELSGNGRVMKRLGNRSYTNAPQGMYLSSEQGPDGSRDRWVMISVSSDDEWIRMCNVIGLDGLAKKSSLRHASGRRRDHDHLDTLIGAWCSGRTCDDIVEALWSAGVPVARVIQAHETPNLDQLESRGFFEVLDHPRLGPTTLPKYPVRLSKGPKVLHRRPAPELGEHNHQILGSILGLSESEIEQLETSGIIGTVPAGIERW